MVSFWALIGVKLIGDVTVDECDNDLLNKDGEVIIADDMGENLKSFLPTYNIFYSLISFDGYPDCMLPALCKKIFFKIKIFL